MVRDLLVIVVVGSVLGLGYNFLGLQPDDGWGLSWIAVDRVGELEEGPTVAAVDAASAAPAPYISDDPLAPAPTAQVALPEIPDVGRPVQIQIDALKQLFDAEAIYLVDAREDWEFAEGHIRGAVSVPFDTVGMDPAALEKLETGGKPIVTYCGGGTCEVSLSLAWEMIGVGHAPIAVYMGGYPEWEAAGFPVEKGEGVAE